MPSIAASSIIQFRLVPETKADVARLIDIGYNLAAGYGFTEKRHRLKDYMGKISLRTIVLSFRTEVVETGSFLLTQNMEEKGRTQ